MAAIEPIMRGDDVLLLAPTAGGKTEAAFFPILSRMADEDWRGLSVLYVCPLRALLNNLEPRLASYGNWLGRSVGLWHGDTTTSVRRRMAQQRPDVLLTTPESLEGMLVSTLLTPRELFADVRIVVVDEVHAFAGDDRGWHLLAVLERLTRIAGRDLQRVGLSATVGNPEELLQWLQGGARGTRPTSVVAPDLSSIAHPDLQLDYVGTDANAAEVIASLHQGEKRLVFADSRRTVESLAVELRARGIETFVSHSSLAVDERRRAETAFSEARDCVIVSTSTLELGVDVGDLDRVLQVGAPGTVASFLQRLGRSGRRSGLSRSMLFLSTTDQELLRAAGLLLLWSEGYVEPVIPPSTPRHLMAQQMLALCLQEGRVGRNTWDEWLGGLALASPQEAEEISSWLVSSEHLDEDTDMLFVGPQAERRYGKKNFLELLSVFTADPQFLVLHGRTELGSIDPMALTSRVEGPRVLSLAGRSWLVTYTDWMRRRTFVEPSDNKGKSKWSGMPQALSYALTDAMRRVLLGADPPGVTLSRRAVARLSAIRLESASTVDTDATVVTEMDNGQVRWWTWAGARANALLAEAITQVNPVLVDAVDRYDNRYLRLSSDGSAGLIQSAFHEARERFGTDLGEIEPSVSDEAIKQLKFGELLPPHLAARTLAGRASDHAGATLAASRQILHRQ